MYIWPCHDTVAATPCLYRWLAHVPPPIHTCFSNVSAVDDCETTFKLRHLPDDTQPELVGGQATGGTAVRRREAVTPGDTAAC